MNNSDIKSRQIACYSDFVKSFLATINNYLPINDFQKITDEFAISLENDFPNPYIFQHYFSAKADLLKYTVSEDINITRANRIIAFCNQLCSLFFNNLINSSIFSSLFLISFFNSLIKLVLWSINVF